MHTHDVMLKWRPGSSSRGLSLVGLVTGVGGIEMPGLKAIRWHEQSDAQQRIRKIDPARARTHGIRNLVLQSLGRGYQQ